MKNLRICLIIVLNIHLIHGQHFTGLAVREGISLDGEWKIIVDPYETGYYHYRYVPYDIHPNPPASAFFMDATVKSPSDLLEYNFDNSKSLQVPGDWNTQMKELYYYEGTIWYRKIFEFNPLPYTNTYIYFDAVNYKAEVYLNGKKLGTHIGGFTPFYFCINGFVKEGKNSLVVKVNNERLLEGVPTKNTDWWNYGGITRKVRLISVPENYIEDYTIYLESDTSKNIHFNIELTKGVQTTLTTDIPELNIKTKVLTDSDTIVHQVVAANNLQLWSPENPKLYKVKIYTPKDTITDNIGFRTIAVKGKQILLNDKPVFLKGICMHEEYAVNGGGRVTSVKQAELLLKGARELGCNFVRLAHYPHNEEIIKLADQMGIMLWAEIPVYWTIDFTNPETYANAKNQMTELIQRDKNRASVIIWSLANETPREPERLEFLTHLANHARKIDHTRLISAAMEKHHNENDPLTQIVEDPLAEITDIVSFNEYIGWYDGTPDKCAKVTWKIPYNKPVFISEFGGGAKQGLHGDKNQRWTEEYQEYLYQESLYMLDKIDGLCGMSPWILIDFRSPRRILPGIQDDFNRKGLISSEGIKKKAFYALQDFYKTK